MILLTKIVIIALIYILTLLFFAHLGRTIGKFKTDTIKDCELHTWVSKVVQIDDVQDTYMVCSKCKKLAGTEFYEETP